MQLAQIKTNLLIFGCWVTLVSCGNAVAQDTSRVPDMDQSVRGVDASVHVGLDEVKLQPPLPPPPQAPVKQPSANSRWGFAPSGQSPTIRFGPAPASSAGSIASPNDGDTNPLGGNFSLPASGQHVVPTTLWTAGHDYFAPDSANENNSVGPVTQPSVLSSLDGAHSPTSRTIPLYSEMNSATSSRRPEPIDFSKANSQRSNIQPVTEEIRNPFLQQTPEDGALTSSPMQQSGVFSSPFRQQIEGDGFSTFFMQGRFRSTPSSYSSSRRQSQAKTSAKRNSQEAKQFANRSQKPVNGSHARSTAGFNSKQQGQPVLH